MKYTRFEDLPVWKAAATLAAQMYDWTNHRSFHGKGDLANQLQRAALSISNNIAEGFERGTTKELLAFLYYARGSAGEVRSILLVMKRMPEFDFLADQNDRMREACESISRQLRAWAAKLQDSEIEGQKHLNTASRQRYDQKQAKERLLSENREFMRDLEARLRRQQTDRENDANQ